MVQYMAQETGVDSHWFVRVTLYQGGKGGREEAEVERESRRLKASQPNSSSDGSDLRQGGVLLVFDYRKPRAGMPAMFLRSGKEPLGKPKVSPRASNHVINRPGQC